MEIKKLTTYIEANDLPKFRLKQILKAIFQDSVSSFDEISTLPKDLREKISTEIDILSFELVDTQTDKNNTTYKALLKLLDGNLIETVLMRNSNKESWTACVSSQVGCAMGCAFCATGKIGFKRNLKSYEIHDQVLFWKQFLKKERPNEGLTNIVFMGMGEPFHNWKEVSIALNKLLDESLFNFSSRGISVSTSGMADKIKQFAKEYPQINLAVSLIFPNDEDRSQNMPVNRTHSLPELAQAINYYLNTTNRKVFLEYVMFQGLNDRPEDARDLASFISMIEKRHLIHINLIKYNSTESKFKPSSKESMESFQELLKKMRLSTSIRRSFGEDIKAACGQLAGKQNHSI